MDNNNKCNPPGFVKCPSSGCREEAVHEVRHMSWYELYVRWREHFGSDYTWKEVSLGRLWWLHMEQYLLANGDSGIDIYNTLNGPATEEYLNQIDKQLRSSALGARQGIAIPRSLRILYRFHDGQNLALHDVRLRTPKANASLHMLCNTRCADRPSRRLIDKQMTLGLFGGVSFYDTNMVSSMLPLEHFKKARDLSFGPHARRLVTHVREDEDGNSTLAPAVDMLADGVKDIGPAFLGPQDCVVFAINSSEVQNIEQYHKVFLVDSIDSSSGEESGDIYTNMSNNDVDCTFIPCVDYRKMISPPPSDSSLFLRSTHSCKSGIKGSLWDWLFEFNRRLTQNRYRFEVPNMCEAEEDSYHMISHFQSPSDAVPRLSGTAIEETAPNHNYMLPSSRLLFSDSTNNSLQGRSFVGSSGVETTFCPSFIPSMSTYRIGESSEFFWAYSIRLRLLNQIKNTENTLYDIGDLQNSEDWLLLEDEKRKGSTTYYYKGRQRQCRLTHRHWVIGYPGDDGSPVEDVVDGEGVIGMFPQLVRGRDEICQNKQQTSHYFGYQSLNRSSAFPSTFSGHLRFVDESSSEFSSNIADMQLDIPAFIY